MYCQSVSYPQFKKKKSHHFCCWKKHVFLGQCWLNIDIPSILRQIPTIHPILTSDTPVFSWILYIYTYHTHTRYIHIYHHISTQFFFVKSLFLLLKSPWLLVKSFFVPRFNHHVCWWNHHFRYLQFAKSPFSNKVGPFSLPSGYD